MQACVPGMCVEHAPDVRAALVKHLSKDAYRSRRR